MNVELVSRLNVILCKIRRKCFLFQESTELQGRGKGSLSAATRKALERKRTIMWVIFFRFTVYHVSSLQLNICVTSYCGSNTLALCFQKLALSHVQCNLFKRYFHSWLEYLDLYPGSSCWRNAEISGFSLTERFVFKKSLKGQHKGPCGQGSGFSTPQAKYKKFS